MPIEKTPVARTSSWREVPQEGMDHTIDDDGISSTANILSGRKYNYDLPERKKASVAKK